MCPLDPSLLQSFNGWDLPLPFNYSAADDPEQDWTIPRNCRFDHPFLSSSAVQPSDDFGMASIWPSIPSPHLFAIPPSSGPAVVPAPAYDESPASQFTIPPALYTELLSFKYPVGIAVAYIITVTYLNRLNKSRGYRPWAFSQTRIFLLAVIAHNVFLAVYSAWTWLGMFWAIKETLPGWKGMINLPEVVDSLCQLHGPRGFGDAAVYNTTISRWTVSSPFIHLDSLGQPDRTDLGRLWNEGLAFYGWLFYVSKFYEVVDTAVIIAKGKKSSLLQTYHHAGAMMSMWAGVRFMSAPIWLFVFINSGIHTLMVRSLPAATWEDLLTSVVYILHTCSSQRTCP